MTWVDDTRSDTTDTRNASRFLHMLPTVDVEGGVDLYLKVASVDTLGFWFVTTPNPALIGYD